MFSDKKIVVAALNARSSQSADLIEAILSDEQTQVLEAQLAQISPNNSELRAALPEIRARFGRS